MIGAGTCVACGSQMRVEYEVVPELGRIDVTSVLCPVDRDHWRANLNVYVESNRREEKP